MSGALLKPMWGLTYRVRIPRFARRDLDSLDQGECAVPRELAPANFGVSFS